MILLTKDLCGLCEEVVAYIHPGTWLFGRLLQSIYLVRFFVVIMWKWILQYVWRKEGKYHTQPVAVSCTCDTEHTALKPPVGRRACSASRVHRCRWLKLHSCNGSTQDWYGGVIVGCLYWLEWWSFGWANRTEPFCTFVLITTCAEKSLYPPTFIPFSTSFAKCFPESECMMVITTSSHKILFPPIPFTLGVNKSLFPLAQLEQVCIQGT